MILRVINSQDSQNKVGADNTISKLFDDLIMKANPIIDNFHNSQKVGIGTNEGKGVEKDSYCLGLCLCLGEITKVRLKKKKKRIHTIRTHPG